MIKYLFFFLACLLTINCATLYDARMGIYSYTRQQSVVVDPIIMPVYLDKTFSLDDQLAIDDALNQWNYALNGYYQFKLVSTDFDMQDDILKQAQANRVLVILKIDHTNSLLKAIHLRDKEVAVAFTNRINGHIIYVVRDYIQNDPDLSRLMLHELGHTLGADDVEQINTLMHWSYIPEYFQCIDLSTLRQIAKVQHFPLSNLNYCDTSLSHSQNNYEKVK
jgi:hypothetical protein